jgi:hypothetical protein
MKWTRRWGHGHQRHEAPRTKVADVLPRWSRLHEEEARALIPVTRFSQFQDTIQPLPRQCHAFYHLTTS